MFRVQSPDPMLISEANSDIAIAFDSPTMIRDPFPLTNIFNLGTDHRTRVMLFGINLDLVAGENSSAVTVRAEDAAMNVFPLTVEFVGKVPGLDWLTQIVVRLPDNTPTGQSLFVTATLRGKMSNKVRIRIR